MAQAARKIEVEEPTLTKEQEAVLTKVAKDPSIVLTDEATFKAYVAALKAEVELNPGSVATEKGRDLIRSNAAGIARKKTAIDNAGKERTEEWRRLTASVNAARSVVKEAMQGLQDTVRAPLTAWEEREKARKEEADAIVADMQRASIVEADATAADLRERLERIRSRNLSDEMFGPLIEKVTDLRDATVKALLDAIERIEQRERDAAELQRLRVAEQARLAKEEEDRRRAEQERLEREQAQRDAEESERRRIEAEERAELDRIAAVEAAKRQAEEAALREREVQERLHREELARQEAARLAEVEAANERVRRAEQEKLALDAINQLAQLGVGLINGQPVSIDKLRQALAQFVIDERYGEHADRVRDAFDQANQRIEQAAEAERKKAAEAAEAERRQRDEDHRTNVKRRAKEVIMTAGVEEDVARKIVLMIAAGEVPAVSIAF